MPLALISSILALTPLAPPPQDAAWQSLPLPSLVQPAAPPARLERLEVGRALIGPRDRPEVRETPAPAALEPEGLLGLLLDEVGARGLHVELHPSAPPLLVRGAPADVATLRAIVEDLDDLGRRLDVSVSVWIETSPSALDAAALTKAPSRAPDYQAVLRSGASVTFGIRRTAAFLTDYQIEVAHRSGVAAPVISRALLGSVLHVRAARRSHGRTVQLECLAEATELESPPAVFDPGTGDLGNFEQPSVRLAQVLFSDLVESGGTTVLAIRGSADGWADRTFWIRAETAGDPPADEPGERSWQGLDLAAFEQPVFDLPLPSPGTGLDREVRPQEPRVLAEAFPAALVALAAQGGSRARPGAVWTPSYLLVPSGSEAWVRARAVIDAFESARLARARLAVTHGALRVDLPLAADQPARVLLGRETLRLVGYRTEIAEQSWMPAPVVEPLFDGLCFQGELESETGGTSALVGTAWVARTLAEREIESADTGLARLQLLTRDFESHSIDLRASPGGSSARAAFAASADAPALTFELATR